MPRDLSKKEIKKNLEFLKSHLPQKLTAVPGIYKLPKKLSDYVIDSNFSQQSLQGISDHIGYFLGVLKSIKITFVDEATDSRWAISNSGIISGNKNGSIVAGLYRAIGYDHSEILLIKKNRYQLKHVLAILAHEYTHFYLHQHHVRENDEYENEILTEVATAYLGLGQFLVNGYKPIVWTSGYYNYLFTSGHTTHTMTIGYVTPHTIKVAIILSVELRRWNPKEVVRSFSSPFDKIIAFLKLWPYRNEIKRTERKKKQDVINNERKREILDTMRKELAAIKESYKDVILRFDKILKMEGLPSITAEDGKRFAELAHTISAENISSEIDDLLNSVETVDNLENLETKKEKLRNIVMSWQELLNKYKK